MSTDGRTRRGAARRRRGRAFAGSFAIVLGMLAAAGLAGAAATTLQGPRVTDVRVDPAAAVAASGSRLIVTTMQSLEEVEESQVTVTPATPFTVDTSGRSIGIRFTLPLYDDTEYTVQIDGVEGVGGGPAATIGESFRTPPIDVFVLRRGAQSDTIFRTDLTGDAAEPVFTHDHIEDFRATSGHLVVSTLTPDDHAELLVTDLAGGSVRTLALPGTGSITNLQSADRGEAIGYTFTDARLSEGEGIESGLFTASVKDAAAEDSPVQIAVTGSDARVAEWRFVPDSDSILLVTFDGALLLANTTGTDAVPLGNAVALDGIARGSSQAVVQRVDGRVVIDLTDGSEAPLVEPDTDLGNAHEVLPLPGAGALRTFSRVENNTTLLGTTVAIVGDDGATDPVFEVAAADALLHTCVSPSGRYAALLIAPDIVDSRYDSYFLPLPEQLETHIIDLTDSREVVGLSGFDISWCQVPPR